MFTVRTVSQYDDAQRYIHTQVHAQDMGKHGLESVVRRKYTVTQSGIRGRRL